MGASPRDIRKQFQKRASKIRKFRKELQRAIRADDYEGMHKAELKIALEKEKLINLERKVSKTNVTKRLVKAINSAGWVIRSSQSE